MIDMVDLVEMLDMAFKTKILHLLIGIPGIFIMVDGNKKSGTHSPVER